MIGRVYSWRGGLWRELAAWVGEGPRNVLLERVGRCGSDWSRACGNCGCYGARRELVVRPARGLRRP